NGWQSAEVRLGDLRDVHWLQPDHAPHELVHAQVSCAAIVSGQIPHACDPGSAPHELRVCVLKKHVVPTAYSELVRSADLRRASPTTSAFWRSASQSRLRQAACNLTGKATDAARRSAG